MCHATDRHTMTPQTYIVDDDEAVRDSLACLLESRGIESQTYPSAEAFLEAWNPSLAGCIVLDIRMEEMSGIELFDRLLELGCRLPVIFLTGHGDVPMAVSTLKNGAFHFIEKPCNDTELVERIEEALRVDAARRDAEESAVSIEVRLKRLSPRERQVMELVLAGKINKQIADELNISVRTVEVRRASVFEKMGVKTAIELGQLIARSDGQRRS